MGTLSGGYPRPETSASRVQHAVWLYFRFTLSFRDVEELLAERGIEVSYESIRYWVLKFGKQYAQKIDRNRPRPGCRWHLDEVFVKINGQTHYLWRAVDDEGLSSNAKCNVFKQTSI